MRHTWYEQVRTRCSGTMRHTWYVRTRCSGTMRHTWYEQVRTRCSGTMRHTWYVRTRCSGTMRHTWYEQVRTRCSGTMRHTWYVRTRCSGTMRHTWYEQVRTRCSGDHAAHLVGANTLLGHHLADLVLTGANTLLGHHLAHLVGAHTLLGHHRAHGVGAGLHPLLRHHLADLVALLLDDRLPLVADAVDFLLALRRHPLLLRDGAGRALLLDLADLARDVALLARARIADPAARLADALGDHRTGDLAGLRLPAATAHLHGLGVVDRLADGLADRPARGSPTPACTPCRGSPWCGSPGPACTPCRSPARVS
jgi:hypothetical protein